jgi:hypothetical protein
MTDEKSGQESERERLTRNFGELLQELRVTQTGSQILAGFLLTVPFSSRYDALTDAQVAIYLVVLCGSVLSTGFVVAPVAFHRVLFHHGERAWIVESANRSARAGLVMLALTSSGVLFLVFDITVGVVPAAVALVVVLTFFGTLWIVVPLRRARAERNSPLQR